MKLHDADQWERKHREAKDEIDALESEMQVLRDALIRAKNDINQNQVDLSNALKRATDLEAMDRDVDKKLKNALAEIEALKKQLND